MALLGSEKVSSFSTCSYLGTAVSLCFPVLNITPIHPGWTCYTQVKPEAGTQVCSAGHLPVGVLVRNPAKLAKSGYESSKFMAPSEIPGLTLEK